MTSPAAVHVPAGLTHDHMTREIRPGCPRCDAAIDAWARAKEAGR